MLLEKTGDNPIAVTVLLGLPPVQSMGQQMQNHLLLLLVIQPKQNSGRMQLSCQIIWLCYLLCNLRKIHPHQMLRICDILIGYGKILIVERMVVVTNYLILLRVTGIHLIIR